MKKFKNIITATTFQLSHIGRFKCNYEIGDHVNSPCGTGIIVELDAETGDCKLKLDKQIKEKL